MENLELYISLILNIVLAIIAYILKKKSTTLALKLNHVVTLISDFITAYQDKVITPEEAKKLMEDMEKIVKDP